MTKRLYLLFSHNPLEEIYVEFSDDRLLTHAELIADDSTIRDRKEFLSNWPGHNGSEPYTEGYDEYAEGFSASETHVLAFARAAGIEPIRVPI